MSERVLVMGVLLSLGIVAWQEQKANHFPPRPHRFVGVALVFSILAIISVFAPALAAAFGIAVALALILGLDKRLLPATTVATPAKAA
jgi:hypothetical protein